MAFSDRKFREETVGLATSMLEKADSENRELTPSEQARFDTLVGTFATVTGKQPPREHAEFRRWANQPKGNSDGASQMASLIGAKPGQGRTRPALGGEPSSSNCFIDDKGELFPCVSRGESFAAAVREKAEAKGLSERDELFVQLADDGLTLGGYLRAHLTGPRNQVERAALQGDDATGGGYVVPTFLSAQVIDMFRARNRVIEAGAQTFEMKAESHAFARVTSVPTCGWVREIQQAPETDMTFGKITFEAKNLRVMLKSSRNLLEDAPNINQLIEQQLAASFAAEVDRAALFGTGAGEPSGLISDTAINEVPVGGSLQGYDSIIDGYKLMLDDNAPDPTAVIMANAQWAYYAKLKDGEDRPAPRPPAIANLPFLATSKATAGTMLMGYFPDLYLGILSSIRIELLRELYAETHQFGFLAHLRMDCGTTRSESFCKLTGITG